RGGVRTVLGEEHAGGSGTGDERGEGAGLATGGERTGGPQRQRGHLHVVAQHGGQYRRVALAQRGQQLVRRPERRFGRVGGPQPIQLPVHGGGGQALVGDGHDPVPGAGAGQYRTDRLTPAGAQRRTPVDQE